jgi:hypothetical protein
MWIVDELLNFFCNSILFAICTSAFSKSCKRKRIKWHAGKCWVALSLCSWTNHNSVKNCQVWMHTSKYSQHRKCPQASVPFHTFQFNVTAQASMCSSHTASTLRRNAFCQCWESNPEYSVVQTIIQTLYRLVCPEWARCSPLLQGSVAWDTCSVHSSLEILSLPPETRKCHSSTLHMKSISADNNLPLSVIRTAHGSLLSDVFWILTCFVACFKCCQ